jgi:metal-sulfur cluster biosynthetic enzyme
MTDGRVAMPADDAILDALREVVDPEAGMNIVDLGLVYGVDVQEHGIRVAMTMTTAACPMADMIVEEAREAIVAATPPGTHVDVDLVWDPPWTPDRMSGIAREHFGWSS